MHDGLLSPLDSPNHCNFLKQLLNKKISKYVLDVLLKDHFHISLPRKYRTVGMVDFLLSMFELQLEQGLTKICALYTGHLVMFN